MSGHGGDVIQELTTDHREVEALFAQIEALPTGHPERRTLVSAAIKELVRHAEAEEAYLYPAYRRALSDGDRIADMEIEEHAEAERTMKELENLPAEDARFDPLTDKLIREIRAHVAEEESDIFPRFAAASTPDELFKLGNQVRTAKAAAPTRPHPMAPDKPPLNKLLGPGTGLLDRARDMLSGRGKR
jgi:hemerythrin superfamily protein